MNSNLFDFFLIGMAVLGGAVFAALHFFEAGYGYLFDRRYGFPVPNRVGWVVMEAPVFILMTVLWLLSERTWQTGPLLLFLLFQSHYLQRAFIFPLLIRGRSAMPAGIVAMGMAFNTLNALMQGGWIFFVSPANYYDDWLAKPYIWIGGLLFLAGMVVNIHSDAIIRRLRKPGDTRHYIPRGGMFRYVSSANYFGDLVKRLTGKTAQEHIRLRLIDAAKERIADPARSIAEVAYELGFKYPAHFTRLFKNMVGCTPNRYRSRFD